MNTAEPSRRGASDFLARLDARHHRVWAFAAVEAPPGMVSGAVADDLGQSVFFESAAFRPPAKVQRESVQRDSAPEVMATDWIAVVRPNEGPWTVVYLALAPRAPHWLNRLFPFAEELAETLGVRAFAARSDEAGEVECRLYDCELLVEEAIFTPGEAFRLWQSSRRESPHPDKVELGFVSETCAGLDLRVPAGYPAVRGDEAFFAAEDDQQLVRVDLLLPPAPTEETLVLEDDETVIFQTGDLESPPPVSAPAPKETERGGWGMKALIGRLFRKSG